MRNKQFVPSVSNGFMFIKGKIPSFVNYKTEGDYSCKLFGKYELWVCNLNRIEKIMVPESLLDKMIEWFHENLSHLRQKRIYNTMMLCFTWKGMKCDMEYFVSTCVKCQKFRRTAQKKYAKLLLRDDIAPKPFYTLQADLIGQFKIGKHSAEGIHND